MAWQWNGGDAGDYVWVDDPVAAPASVAQQVSGYSNTPIQQFNQLYQSGDYAGAGQLAAAQGYTPDQVTGYLNSTFGTNYSTANVAPYMTGIATPAPAPAPSGYFMETEGGQYWVATPPPPAPVVGPQPVAGPQPTLATTVANTPGITYEAGNYGLPTNAPQNLISSYYQSELGRAPDMGGVSYWANQVATGAMTLDQVRQALNASEEGVAFDANPVTGAAALSNWLTKNPNATDAQIAYQMNLYGVTPEQAGSVFTGVSPTDIQQRYQAATPYVDLFNTYQVGDVAATNAALLKSGLTPDQLASAFSLDPTELQALRAQGYNIGFAQPEITGAFGTTTDFENLNKGFEWAQANKVDDARLKEVLGEDTYNQYKQQYGQGILSALQPALADNSLSAQEALDVVTQAKKYGLDAGEIAKYTGLDAKVPQAFFDTYDKALTGIVGNALSPETSPEDKARTALTLAAKYGLSDADIAKYSSGKLTEQDVKGYLDPTRNFGRDFQALYSNPNTTAQQIVDFLDKAKADPVTSLAYGTRFTEMEPQIAEFRRLADIGQIKDYSGAEYNPLTITRLAGQIGQNFDPSRSSGGAFSTSGESIGFNADEASRLLGTNATAPQQVILDMARHLAQLGVTDISQLKPGTREIPGYTQYGESGDTEVPPRLEQGFYVGDKFIPAGEIGATYTGKGNTRYNMEVDPATGQPKFYTQAKSSSDLSGGLGTLLALGASFFGAPMLATALGNLGITGLASTALSQGLISGGLSSLSGGDFAKGFFGGAVAPVVGGGVASLLADTGLNPTLAKGLASTAGNVASTAIRGGNVEDALKGGITSGLLNTALDPVYQSLNLSPQQLKLLSGIVVPSLLSGQVNPYNAARVLASTAKG